MTGIDTNILIDLLVSSTPTHLSSTEAVKQLHDDICTTPTNVGECLRLLTHPRIFPKPLKTPQAVTALEELFDYYQIRTLEEDSGWWKELPEMEKEIPGLRGNEIFDARVALCFRFNSVKRVFTRDADFKKYSFLQAIQFFSGKKK